MSQRSSFGRNGFQQIPEQTHSPIRSPTDHATVDIPLTTVKSATGSRKQGSGDMNEKQKDVRIGPQRKRGFRELRGRPSEVDDVTTMGKIYNKILNFSIVTRYLLYILPVGAILAVPIILGATLKDPVPSLGGVKITWIFAWALTMWVGLWAAKLFAKTTPYIFEFLCGIVSPGTRKYSTILKALEIPLSLVGWSVVSLATFQPILTNSPNPTVDGANQDNVNNWEGIVQKILAAFVLSSVVYLVEKVLIQVISVNYHRMQYDMKIKESKDQVKMLSVLYDASISWFPAYCPEFQEEDYLISDSPDLGIPKSHQRSGSATPLRLLANVGRLGDKVTAAFGSIAHEVTGKEVFNPTASHSVVVEALEKKRSSEALAKRIWMSFVVEGKEALYQEDLIEVLQDRSQAEAIAAFELLDQDGNGDVNLDEMILKVCEIGRNRKAIASSLHDVDQAIDVLDNLLLTAVFFAVVLIFIAFLQSSFVTTLATTGTALLSLSFIFSATAAEILGSCIFLFVKHPFDVGDIVVIATNRLVVERVSLLYTVFLNTATHTNTQCPNAVLNTLWIDNVSRSKAMREQLLIDVSFDTTLEDVQLLQKEMQNFVRDKENSRDFEPDIEIELADISSMSKMQLRVEIRQKSNWSNSTLAGARRSRFMCALVLALRKVPIYAPGGGAAALGSADQPTYSVAVSDAQAAAARDAFAKAKAEKHIKTMKSSKAWNDLGNSTGAQPTNGGDGALRNRSPAIAPYSETNALQTLNARSPASDIAADWQSEDSSPINRRPSSRIHSPHLAVDGQLRSKEIDEVYGVLRRASTRGKRRESDSHRAGYDHSSSNIPIIEEPNPSTTSLNYHDYAREMSNASKVDPSKKSSSPPKAGAHYNPYVTAAPQYEYPPSSGNAPMNPLQSAPVTSSTGAYSQATRPMATQQAQTQAAASGAVAGAAAAELEGQGNYQ